VARWRGAGRIAGWLRELCAALAAGLVVLSAGLFVAWAVAASAGAPGPGVAMLAGHLVGAVAAVACHRVARKRSDLGGRAAGFGPPIILLVLGYVFWWG
jgi:hypothetical protein